MVNSTCSSQQQACTSCHNSHRPYAKGMQESWAQGQPECVCRSQPAAALHLPKARATLATAVYAVGMVMCFKPRGIRGSTTEASSMLLSEAPAACWADGVGVGLGVALPAAPPSLVLACSLFVGTDNGNTLAGLSGLTDWLNPEVSVTAAV